MSGTAVRDIVLRWHKRRRNKRNRMFFPDADGVERRAALSRPDEIQQVSAKDPVDNKTNPAGTAPSVVPAESLKRLTLGSLTRTFSNSGTGGRLVSDTWGPNFSYNATTGAASVAP